MPYYGVNMERKFKLLIYALDTSFLFGRMQSFFLKYFIYSVHIYLILALCLSIFLSFIYKELTLFHKLWYVLLQCWDFFPLCPSEILQQ
jgi:hypothetical protein